MNSATCQACGSNKIMHDLLITDVGHYNEKNDLSIQIKTTDRLIFNTYKKTTLKAKVCGSCGKVDLKVSHPQQLWEAYNKNKI